MDWHTWVKRYVTPVALTGFSASVVLPIAGDKIATLIRRVSDVKVELHQDAELPHTHADEYAPVSQWGRASINVASTSSDSSTPRFYPLGV